MLLHYSDTPITEILSVEQPDQVGLFLDKPFGLWISIDDAWAEFCRGIDRNPGSHVYQVTLCEGANLAMIRSLEDLQAFSREFGGHPAIFDKFPGGLEFNIIDWKKVAARHDGIFILRRFSIISLDEHSHWVNGWDVASGCIWNKAAICDFKSVTPAHTNKTEA